MGKNSAYSAEFFYLPKSEGLNMNNPEYNSGWLSKKVSTLKELNTTFNVRLTIKAGFSGEVIKHTFNRFVVE